MACVEHGQSVLAFATRFNSCRAVVNWAWLFSELLNYRCRVLQPISMMLGI